MSSTSAPLSLSVCIKRSWASFPLPRLSCRKFNSCLTTSEVLPGRPGRSRSLTHGRHLCRPCLRMAGTLVAPYNSWPSVPWRRISNRHFSCRGGVGFQSLLDFHPAFHLTLMSVKEAAQNVGSLSNTRFDSGRRVLTHPVLYNFQGHAQPLHFFALLFLELEDVFQSSIFRKNFKLLVPHFRFFNIHKLFHQRIVRRGAGENC